MSQSSAGDNFQINQLVQLLSIMRAQDWHLGEKDVFVRRFEDFSKMLILLTAPQQEMMLKLIERFHWCPGHAYPNLTKQLCLKISTEHLGTGKDVYIVPLIPRKDSHKVKSGSNVAYIVKSLHHELPVLKDKNLIPLAAIEKMDFPACRRRSKATVIFVDDFIGSGDTAISALNEFEAAHSKCDDAIILVSLVAQQIGLKKLRQRLSNILVGVERQKGIADSNDFPDKQAAYATMRSIEDRLQVADDYRFGYGQSEGLEAMMRTPNNTFPVFWHKGKRKSAPWPAPFPR